MYNFIFDRRSLTLMLGGLAIAGGLVFFAGLLVGVSWTVPYPAARVVSRPVDCPPSALAATPAPAPAPVPARVPAEPPVLEELEAEDPELAAEPPAPEPPAEEPAALEPEPPPAEPAPRGLRTVPAATHSGDIEEAGETGRYAVQVGAFSKPENSEAVVRDLESRGYDPYVLPLQGSRRRVLHTVRIGRFDDRDEAIRAASDFRHKEKMAAIVLPSDSL